MKSYTVIYKHGHFFEGNKRIIPTPGKLFTICGDDDSFETKEERFEIGAKLNADKKKEEIKKQNREYIKILDAESKLFFRIGKSKEYKGDTKKEYYFSCKLEEDLYLLRKKGKKNTKGNDPQEWSLAECKCELISSFYGGISTIENIRAVSLNKLFSNTVMYYFSMERTSACNVFTTFFHTEKDYGNILGLLNDRKNQTNLNDLRAKKVKEYCSPVVGLPDQQP